MAKKISLWISALYHPIPRSPSLAQSPMETAPANSRSTPWTVMDQNADTLVNTSPDIGRRPERKESLGGGVIVREQLIRDLE